MRSVWKAWFQFWLKQHHLRIDVLFSYIVIARTTDRLPDTHLKFECNGLDFYFIIFLIKNIFFFFFWQPYIIVINYILKNLKIQQFS